MEKKNTITITQIQYQLIEVYNQIEVPLDELKELIDSNDENEVFEEIHDRFYDADNIIYYATADVDIDDEWDGELQACKIPYNEHSYPMGNIILIDDNCVSYHMDERIATGVMKTDIHDFSKKKLDTLSNYVNAQQRINCIKDIIE